MDTASLEERIARLEQQVSALVDEMQLQRARGTYRAAQSATPPPRPMARPIAPPSPTPRAPMPGIVVEMPARESGRRAIWTGEDLESFVGRYGMLALATFAGLAAVGSFIGWAASRVELGPHARVILGLALALALAVAGVRIRPREHSFGAILLGLALAVTHACAWGAGPVLGLATTEVALLFALSASVALAVFAHRVDDETLWCVGFGGAAIAPFVTSDGGGSMAVLAAYGAAVLLLGSWALRHRAWPVAGRVLTLSAALFAATLVGAPDATGGGLLALGLVMLVSGAGVIRFTAPAHRRARLRAFGLLAVVACIDVASGAQLVSEGAALAAIAAAALLWIVYVDVTATLPAGSIFESAGSITTSDTGSDAGTHAGAGTGAFGSWVDAAVVPLGFLLAANWLMSKWLAQPRYAAEWAAPAALAVVMLAFASRRPAGALRDAAAFAASIGIVAAAWNLAAHAPDWRYAAVAGAAVLLAVLRNAVAARPWTPVAIVTLASASVGALQLLAARVPYAYEPFRTVESAIAACVVAGWFGAALVRGRRSEEARGEESVPGPSPLRPDSVPTPSRLRPDSVPTPSRLRPDSVPSATILHLCAWVMAFTWVHRELHRAWSPAASAVLVTSLFAVTSVIVVGVGRRMGEAPLRHVGLVLAIVAAYSAARGAAGLEEPWARIGGYLVTSVFLLALAWWYRRKGSGEEAELGDSFAADGASSR